VLLRFEEQAHAGERWQPDSIAVLLARRGFWQSVRPRRFRYVEVVGLNEIRWAGVMPVSDAGWSALAQRPIGRSLFGVPVDPVRIPIVEETWERLQPLG
jgi:hypothetical protein